MTNDPPAPNVPPAADPLLEEVRAIRLARAARFGNDPRRLAEDARAAARRFPGSIVSPEDVRARVKKSA